MNDQKKPLRQEKKETSKTDEGNTEKIKKETIEIIDVITESSKISFKQENDRSNTFLTKSDNLFKYSSTIITLINTILPILYINKVINTGVFITSYLNIVPFVATIYYTSTVQKLANELYFPAGEDIINEVKKEKIDNIMKAKNLLIMYYSSSTKSLNEKNNFKAGQLNKAYNLYITGIFTMLATVIILFSISCISNISQENKIDKKNDTINNFEINLFKINPSLKRE